MRGISVLLLTVLHFYGHCRECLEPDPPGIERAEIAAEDEEGEREACIGVGLAETGLDHCLLRGARKT